MRVQEELYQWWAKRNKTISYVSSGILSIVTLPEDEAFEILKNSCFKLAKREHIPWDEFEKRRLQKTVKEIQEREVKSWTCKLCGRNKFQRPGQPHKCVGGFRKNFKKAARLRGWENCWEPTKQ